MWQILALTLSIQFKLGFAYYDGYYYQHYFDWGDFHKFAVIFFSFLGTFVILGGILTAAYFACFRPWLDRVKEDIAETHRMHHPWPVGSARWYFQKWLKSNRSSSSSSGKFPPMSASLNRYPTGYLVEPKQQTDFPIYESAHPSYYAPAQAFSPSKLEKIEEYRLVREESTLSQSGGKPVSETASRSEDRIVRTTTTQHNQQFLRAPATYI